MDINDKEPIIYQVRAVGPPLFKVWLPVLRSNERLEIPCCQLFGGTAYIAGIGDPMIPIC
jgi:hypothetical protein